MPAEDPRKSGLKRGLRQLSCEQIGRLLDWILRGWPVLLDRAPEGEANYYDGAYCPLAVAVGVPEECARDLVRHTDDGVRQRLEQLGLSIYNTRGIPGEFYQTPNRLRDLQSAALEVLQEKLR